MDCLKPNPLKNNNCSPEPHSRRVLNSLLDDYGSRVEAVLQHALNNIQSSNRLAEAIRYSTLNGGKRLRAALVYASGTAVGARQSSLDPVAAALECVHAYSLIHDDLPAMDDDELRRGQATNHVKYDEATAILAGDALQALAFELITSPDSGLSDRQSRQVCLNLATNSGHAGMVGGQMLDILATGQQLDRESLENIHRGKTGALISSAVVCGALCGEQADPAILAALEDYAANIGLAFQVVDDVLDVESSTDKLGKKIGADQLLGKSTYPTVLGLEQSKRLAQTLYQQAIASVSSISDNTALVELAALIVNRKH